MGFSWDDNPISNATSKLGAGSNWQDPYAVGRGILTGGLSAAYGAYQQPGKNAQQKAQDDYSNTVNQQYQANQGLGQGIKNAGDAYYNTTAGANQAYKNARAPIDAQYDNMTTDYTNRSRGLMNQASDQASNAQSTYTNLLKPKMQGIMEDAQTQANQAMSLADAGDMNNTVQQGVRKFYNDQASGENAQGLNNVGIMSALGAQALKGQLGSSGVPMTGGQIQALQGQNMAQAGSAYAQTQQRIQALKDQGIAQGIAQSNAQYQRGQQARDYYGQTVNNMQNADQSNLASQAASRGEQNSYSGQIYGANMNDLAKQYGSASQNYGMDTGLGAIGYQNALNATNTQMGIGNQYYDQQRGMAAGNMAAGNAQVAAQNGMLGSVLGTGATVAGGVFGGPMGAALGQQAGGMVGQGLSQAPGPQYGGGGGGQSYAGGGYGGQYAGGGGQAGINPYMFQKNQQGQFANWQPQ